MEMKVTKYHDTVYRPMFGGEPIPMTLAVVEFPEHGITMGLSHRSDDPVGVWCADWRIEANGMVNFSHGDGDRSCKKQIAGPELVEAILGGVIL